MGNIGAFLGEKRSEPEADNSPPTSVEFKEWVELYLHSPYMPSWNADLQIYFCLCIVMGK